MKTVSIKFLLTGSVLLAGLLVASAQSLAVRTMAGGTAAGTNNGYGSNARFNHPAAVTADPSGSIFVADTGNGTIRKLSAEGLASDFAGFAGQFGSGNGVGTNARFCAPQGIARDPAGNLLVADTANGTIRKISPAGLVTTLAGLPATFNSYDATGANARFWQPEGIAVDNGSTAYVADTWNHTIRKILPVGTVTTLAGLAGHPGSADGMTGAARFNRPNGVAVDATTNVFVTDSLNHTIRKITPAGAVSTIAGLAGVWGSVDGTNSSARFFQPQGIVALGTNTLFVIDSGNQSIRKVVASGTNWVVSTVAGLDGLAGSANGTGAAAQFYFPAGLTIDAAGFLYVADAGNHLIRTTRVVPPTLQSLSSANQMLLTWPTSAEDFTLEVSPDVGPGSVWTPVTNGIVNLGDNFGRTNSIGQPAAYYRLRRP